MRSSPDTYNRCLFRVLPPDVAIEAYRWILGVSTKGNVISCAKDHGNDVVDIWKSLRSDIRNVAYYLRLWKAVATSIVERCNWCVYYVRGKCRNRSCRYTYSPKKSAALFGVDRSELMFILNSLTEDNFLRIEDFVNKKVKVILPVSFEEQYYQRVYTVISKLLEEHLAAKVWKKRGRVIATYFGVDPEDIFSDLSSQLFQMIRRYDYLDINSLLRVCSRSLRNSMINMTSRYFSVKRKSLIRMPQSEEQEILSDVDRKESPGPSPEDMTIEKDLLVTASTIFGKLNGDLRAAVEILLGQEDRQFLDFLKNKQQIRTTAGWESFYRKIDPVVLMNLINEFSGKSVDRILGNMIIENHKNVRDTIREKNREVIVMEKQERKKVVVPRFKCIICGHFIPWLDRKPRDCSPAYPGCPAHNYNFVREFPVGKAAGQLAYFVGAGDDVAVKEFIRTAPDICKILERVITCGLEESDEEATEISEDSEELSDNDIEEESDEEPGEETEDSEGEEDDIMVVGEIEPGE